MSFIEKLLFLSYQECVDCLLKKYGSVPGDFFIDKSCSKVNTEIFREDEGLLIHHIDEDKFSYLFMNEYALEKPFIYQKADRLVYCNLLEHFVLHIKIVEYPNPKRNRNELCGIGTIVTQIIPDLDEIYELATLSNKKQKPLAEAVISLKEDYKKCLKRVKKIDAIKEYWDKTIDYQEKRIVNKIRESILFVVGGYSLETKLTIQHLSDLKIIYSDWQDAGGDYIDEMYTQICFLKDRITKCYRETGEKDSKTLILEKMDKNYQLKKSEIKSKKIYT